MPDALFSSQSLGVGRGKHPGTSWGGGWWRSRCSSNRGGGRGRGGGGCCWRRCRGRRLGTKHLVIFRLGHVVFERSHCILGGDDDAHQLRTKSWRWGTFPKVHRREPPAMGVCRCSPSSSHPKLPYPPPPKNFRSTSLIGSLQACNKLQSSSRPSPTKAIYFSTSHHEQYHLHSSTTKVILQRQIVGKMLLK